MELIDVTEVNSVENFLPTVEEGNDYIDLTWTASSRHDYFDIYYILSSAEPPTLPTEAQTEATEYRLTGLEKGRKYTITIIVYSFSKFSDPVSVQETVYPCGCNSQFSFLG